MRREVARFRRCFADSLTYTFQALRSWDPQEHLDFTGLYFVSLVYILFHSSCVCALCFCSTVEALDIVFFCLFMLQEQVVFSTFHSRSDHFAPFFLLSLIVVVIVPIRHV
ncbi:hypothetical protein VTN00DRAFT_1292 [Thermoascus crustaceus]|uniref:uncharacterized protein n=1 Tax=Thermoascus crustaceus TaxID=5088 RepID=UPI003743AAE2